MAQAVFDPRPTLVAYGAPLPYAPRREVTLEEAIAHSLVAGRDDPTLVLALTVVLLDNETAFDGSRLRDCARRLGVESELGMMLALAAEVGARPSMAKFAAGLARPAPGSDPVYYPQPAGGRRGRALADRNTPAVVAQWGFRMNETEEDLRAFVEKHRG